MHGSVRALPTKRSDLVLTLFPSNVSGPGSLKSSWETGPCSLLSYPSRSQEGSIPLLTRLEVLDVGRFAWISARATATNIHSETTTPHPSCQLRDGNLHPATSPQRELRDIYCEHLQIGISFLVLVCLSTAHRPPVAALLPPLSRESHEPPANARYRPRCPPRQAETPPQPWRCPRPSPPCTRRQSLDHGATAAICPRSHYLEHTAWDPRASTSGT
jgi:hypothetical protein